jgi:hypothetical protein
MNQSPICPCDRFTHPKVIANPPGRPSIAYRVGDYATFRRALLLALQDESGNLQEQELTNWRPTAQGELALQLVEWWAYLADILTFYNERAANQAYLSTADLPESLHRLIRILGYRPRPGIGAQGTVAALTNGSAPFTVPEGFPLQSKPGPGKQPQIFEVNADTAIAPDQVPGDGIQSISTEAIATQAATPPPLLDDSHSLLLKGKVTTVKAGDRLLLLKQEDATSYAWLEVASVQSEPQPDSDVKVNTRITFTETPTALKDAQLADYRLYRSAQFTYLWSFPTGSTAVINTDSESAHLSTVVRQIQVGDRILFTRAGQITKLVSVTSYSEVVWYANHPKDPTKPLSDKKTPSVPITHTLISFSSHPKLETDWNENKNSVVIYFDWQKVGQLIPTPLQEVPDQAIVLADVPPPVLPAGATMPVLLEDAKGQGVAAQVSANHDKPSDWVVAQAAAPSMPLKTPLSLLFNRLSVSRGQTVPAEILGSGDASIAGQAFILQKSPLTYLLSGDPTLAAPYKSTLQIWVEGVEWQEVPSFYGQSADARVFVTREDEEQKTHVLFGDGVHGARLPSGRNNIKARYRYGSGASAPEAGALTIMVNPHPRLKSIRNPVSVGGGADPDAPQHIRRYAPQSVLTFGRAVSARDYEAIAAQTPGVARVRVYWTWDAQEQQSLVKLYVGDDDNAVRDVKMALRRAADPNRPIKVESVIPIPIKVTLTLRIASSYEPAAVREAVRRALLDPDTGLFGTHVIQIGQAIYRSQIHGACLRVPGVLAVHDLQFSVKLSFVSGYWFYPGKGGLYPFQGKDRGLLKGRTLQLPVDWVPIPGHRFAPGEGGFCQLQDADLEILEGVGP